MKAVVTVVVVALLFGIYILRTATAQPFISSQIYHSELDDANDVIIFEDHFDAGYTHHWSFTPEWAVVMEAGNGFLNAPASGTAELFTPIILSDYRFLADIRLWDGYTYLVFRKSSDNGYRLKVAEDGLILVRAIGSDLTHLANSTMPITIKVWHTIKVSCIQDHIYVFVDGNLQIDVVDPDPWYAGSIALEASGDLYTEADFDNVILKVKPAEVQNLPWVQTNGPMGGPITTIDIDPTDPNCMYAGGNDGNIFKTIDAGATWISLPRPAPLCTSIRDLIVSPADPLTLFSLILDESGSGDLYRSSNGGDSWSSLFPGKDTWITCVAMDPEDPLNLATGALDGQVMGSSDGGDTWTDITANLPHETIADIAATSGRQIWVGTADGYNGRLFYSSAIGVEWDEVPIFGKPLNTDINSVSIDPSNINTIYVGLKYVPGGQAPPEFPFLYKTTDHGQSWTNIYLPDPGSAVKILCCDSSNNALYVANGCCIYKDSGQGWITVPVDPLPDGDVNDMDIDPRDDNLIFLPRISGGILKSTDAGDNWEFCDDGISNTNVQLMTLSRDPGVNRIYVGAGMDIFKSTDNGKIWNHGEDIWAHQTAGEMHPAPAALQASPFDPETVWYISDVGQIYKTQDSALTWNKLADPFMIKNNDAETAFRWGSIHALTVAPSDPYTLYASKNGFGLFKSVNSGHSWEHLPQAEVDYTLSIAVHPSIPDIVYAGSIPKPFQNEGLLRQSTDGGQTWRTSLSASDSSGITSVAIDPGNPSTVYAGSTGEGGNVWVSYDEGDTWANINDRFDFTNVHVFTADPAECDVAYAGVWGGGTFRTSDAGETWTPFLNRDTISAIAILVDPTDSDILYFADRTTPNIFRTLDGGLNWESFFYAGELYYRVLSAALAPGNPTVLYAACLKINEPVVGDVFRIENGVSTCVTGTLERTPVALAVDPSEADTVYAVLHAHGVYKTSDGGSMWHEISGANSGLPQTPEVGFSGLVIDPTDTDRLYLFGGCDVDLNYMHTGADPSDMHTVYKSTDGGTTWANLNDGLLGANSDSIKGLAIAPYDPDVLFIGALKGVFRSLDGGATWEDISSGLGYEHTAGAELNTAGTRLYIPTLGGGVYGGAVDPINSSVTWDEASRLIATIHHVQVSVDPSSSSTLYASAFPGGIFKSENGGSTWVECNFGIPSFFVHDPASQGYYSLAVCPSNPDLLFLGMYRVGLFKSTDGGGIWQPAHGANLEMFHRPISGMIVDPSDVERVYVATSSGFYVTTDGGASWLVACDGLDCLDVRTIAVGSDGMLYAGTKGYEVYTSDTQSGIFWSQLTPFSNFGQDWPVWDIPLSQRATILLSPTDPDSIYLGSFPTGFFQSHDGGLTWRESTAGLGQEGIFALTFDPDDEQIIFAGTSGGIKRLNNSEHQSCVQWKSKDDGWPAEHWVLSIDFDPFDSNLMYACSKNGANKGQGEPGSHGTVMKSTNRGYSWFPITTGLNQDQEFYKILADPFSLDTLYLATQSEGVFISYDGGALWKPWNEGLTCPEIGGSSSCDPLNISADGVYIFLGTKGAGVFRRQFVGMMPR